MREIKFRAWLKNTGVMEYPEKQWHMFMWAEDENQSIEIMQFTGLHDKNGTPVYESDIINEGSSIGVVGWCDVYHRWEYKTQTSSAGLYLFNGEVIGNIYQHPELINRR